MPLVIWCFWIGIYPKPYFEVLEKPIARIVERLQVEEEAPSVTAAVPEIPSEETPSEPAKR